MKKTILSLSIATVLAATAFSAQAADNGQFYAGATVGQSQSTFTGLTSRNATSVGLMAGYQITPNVAAEVSYADFGRVSSGAVTERTTGYNVSAVGTLPIDSAWSAYGKLGYGSLQSKTSLGLKTNHSAATFGLGVQYAVNSTFSIRAGYDRSTAAVGFNTAHVHNYALTGIYAF